MQEQADHYCIETVFQKMMIDLVSSGNSGLTVSLNRPLENFAIKFRSDIPIFYVILSWFRSFGGPNVLRWRRM